MGAASVPDQDDVYRDDLLRMPEDEFRLVWELIVGERPAIMLERGEMIDALRSLIPLQPAPPHIPGLPAPSPTPEQHHLAEASSATLA